MCVCQQYEYMKTFHTHAKLKCKHITVRNWSPTELYLNTLVSQTPSLIPILC